MWGIFRTFETRQDGEDGSDLDSADCVYAGRRIGQIRRPPKATLACDRARVRVGVSRSIPLSGWSPMTTTLPAAGLFTGTSKAEAILAAVVFGAQKFMYSADWSVELEQWLERLGVATGVAVVRLFENDPLEEGGMLCTSACAQWLATHDRGSSMEGLQHVPYVASGCARWIDVLSRGEALVGNREDFPVSERAIMEREQVVSMAIVPVFAGATWWGFLGFAEFDEKRPWLEGEMHALFAAAGILGAALHRRAMEQRIADSAARDQLTTEIGDVLTASTHRLEDVLHMCSARIAHHLDAALVCVWTAERDHATLCAGRAASSTGVSVQPSNVRIGEYAIGQIAQSHSAQTWNEDVHELCFTIATRAPGTGDRPGLVGGLWCG